MSKGRSRPPRVLFVNTRSALGADVAVHLLLMRSLDPSQCVAAVATNAMSRDLARTLEQLRPAPLERTAVLNLGYELAGRGRLARLMGAAGNAAVLAVALVRLAWLTLVFGADVIHTTDRPRDALLGMLLAALTRRRHLVHFHIKWYPGMGRATTWALRRCAGALAISEFVKQSLVEGGMPAERVFTAYNATDPAAFQPSRMEPAGIRQRLAVPEGALLLGIVARIIVWKGHLELVQAMAAVRERVPDAHLVIVGSLDATTGGCDEEYASRVRAEVARLGLTECVHWLGWSDHMAAVYADLDVVCVPSWEEPFGLVVTEAMAMERPVVGFRAGALPEIVCDGDEGLLVPQRDVGALADAIVALARDPALRRRMGSRGRARVLASFTPQHQADSVTRIYEALCRS